MKNGNYLLIRIKKYLDGTRIANLCLVGDFLHIHLPPSLFYFQASEQDDTVVIDDKSPWLSYYSWLRAPFPSTVGEDSDFESESRDCEPS